MIVSDHQVENQPPPTMITMNNELPFQVAGGMWDFEEISTSVVNSQSICEFYIDIPGDECAATNVVGLYYQTTTCTACPIAGCSMTASFSSFNNPACAGGNTGDATISSSDGTSPYTYIWSNGQTNQQATGLLASTYYVTVYDNAGCEDSSSVTLTNPPAVTADITSFTNPSSCQASGDGTATATASGGTGSIYTYSWTTAPVQTTTTATGLFASVLYTVTVWDSLGCSAQDTITLITSPPSLAVSITADNNPSCNGDSDGRATANASGGTGAYTYKWSDPASQTTTQATGLLGGVNFIVTVTDSLGCFTTDNITLTDPSVLTASIISSTMLMLVVSKQPLLSFTVRE